MREVLKQRSSYVRMGKEQGCKTLKVGSKEEKAKAETPPRGRGRRCGLKERARSEKVGTSPMG